MHHTYVFYQTHKYALEYNLCLYLRFQLSFNMSSINEPLHLYTPTYIFHFVLHNTELYVFFRKLLCCMRTNLFPPKIHLYLDCIVQLFYLTHTKHEISDCVNDGGVEGWSKGWVEGAPNKRSPHATHNTPRSHPFFPPTQTTMNRK